jgi:hypothetical protein
MSADLPTFIYGGELLDIYDVMHRYRNDGSCEELIAEALTLLAASGRYQEHPAK